MKAKQVVGLVLMLAGVAFGLYAGLWWAFVGGIVDVIVALRAPEIAALDAAIGVAKIVFAGVIGGLSGMLAVAPGFVLLVSE